MSDRLPDDLQEELGSKIADAVRVASEPQSVPVNLYEAEGALVLLAPLPGVMPGDITVTVDGDQLHIAASMRSPAAKDYLVHEWHYGPYERTVDIPAGFSGQPVATFGNGQLALRIPRGADGTPGRVTIGPSA